jgi:hypothetical protein
MRPTLTITLLCAALSTLAAGCASHPQDGYAFGAATPEHVKSVYVPMFGNQSLHPGLEASLTENIIKQVQAATPMRVIQRADAADSTLTGAITDVQFRRLSLASSTGLVQEVAITLTVDFEWRDARTGDVLAARRRFSSSDSFVPSRPTGERLEVGQHAALQRMAQDIVAQMRSAW